MDNASSSCILGTFFYYVLLFQSHLISSYITSNMTVSFTSFSTVQLGIFTKFLDFFDAKFLKKVLVGLEKPKMENSR